MALNIQNIKRVFKLGNVELQDPNPDMSPEEIMNFYSNKYPELTTSNVHGPAIVNGRAEYEFKTTVGTKG